MTPGIKQINDNFEIVDSPPASPMCSRSDSPTGIGMGREITASYQCESLLEQLPLEIKYKVIDSLNLPAVALLKRTCSKFYNAIKEGDALAKAWYQRFPSALQAQLKRVISTKDNNQLSDWLGQFTNDEVLIKSLIQRRKSDQFPAIFYFTITELMSKCETFEWVGKGEISHGGEIRSATFSGDGRHVVTVSSAFGEDTAKISGQDINGSWYVKTSCFHTDLINSATFSPDGNHLVTASYDCTARIYSLEADGSWQEKETITYDRPVSSATFSPDSTLLLTASYGRTAKIYGLEANGSWVPKASISHRGSVCSATFSVDGCYVITCTGSANGVKILSQEEDGSWLENATVPYDNHATSATFSYDGTHVLTVGVMPEYGRFNDTPSNRDGTHMVKIYGHKTDGSWELKADIRHSSWVTSADFSTDGSHIVTASVDGTAKIYGLKADGSWESKTTIRHGSSVPSVTFSADSRHLLIASQNKTVKIYGLKDGVWNEKASITHDGEVNSAVFSTDSRHVVTASKDKTAKIIGQQLDGSWVVKASISHQGEVNS
ncbi:WD40 repeat domain-containing protein, partial [Endozoicomonas sp. ONNA1]